MERTAAELFEEGTRLLGAGDLAGAERALRAAVRIAPRLAAIHANLALLLDRQEHREEAEVHYRLALEIAPHQVQTLVNYGVMLTLQKRIGEAEPLYRRALALEPSSPATWSNLGVLLAGAQREDEAEQSYRTALAFDPGYAKASFNLAYLLLRQGRYEEGWEQLEARDCYAPLEDYMRCPRWRGEPLQGKSLLIGFEAGHGDMIQFCRYAPLVKQRGAARVSVLCHPVLKTLFTRLAGADEIIAFDEPLAADGWDYWTPPLSLPSLFATRLDTIPAALPYLSAESARAARWGAAMASAGDRLRIGLAWKGNPLFENDADRSLPSLALLTPLAEVVGVRFYSLQKGRGEDEAAAQNGPLALTDLGSRIADFADTAAVIANLDLVITVDTAVAHLAGALGKPVWVLLPAYKPDWRWLADRCDSPWYPQVMRLFRQRAAGDWSPVVVELQAALRELAARAR